MSRKKPAAALAAADDVAVPRDDLRKLLEASDILAEHMRALAAVTPSILGEDAAAMLQAAELAGEDGAPTDAFMAAMVRSGRALGLVKPPAAPAATAH